jgi:hypothetical protein
MTIIMNHTSIKSINDIKQLNKADIAHMFSIHTAKERYAVMGQILTAIKYIQLSKKDKGIAREFLLNITEYSKVQIKRLIHTWKSQGLTSKSHHSGGAHNVKYHTSDIARLIETDIAHESVNGLATRLILEREYKVFGKSQYAGICGISLSHLYNIRNKNQQYRSSEALVYTKTRPTQVDIGERRRPSPYGKPGFIRIDSVHQGDLDTQKGVYHINVIDEVTQFELVGCIPQISDEYMVPLIESLIAQFPFTIINFHSDNGSEYVNHKIAHILKRLLISQSKSR